MAAKKQSKAATPQVQLTVEHPAAPQVLAMVNDHLQSEAQPKPRRKPAPRLTLSETKMHELSGEAEALGMMLMAIKRLSWLADDTDADARDAATVALESISLLGTMRADALSRALGGMGIGDHDGLVERLANRGRQ